MKKIILSVLCFGSVAGVLQSMELREEQQRLQARIQEIVRIRARLIREMMLLYPPVPTQDDLQRFVVTNLALYGAMPPSEERDNIIAALRQLLPPAGR